MKKLGVAITGTGWVSGEHIRAYQMNPNTEVVAIISRSESKGRAKAAEMALKTAPFIQITTRLLRI